MVHFVECSIPVIEYIRGRPVFNNPVNLDNCTSLKKSKYAWYPDNVGLPSIVFEGCNVQWAYKREAERDEDFARIVRSR